jgi:predicted nucleotidyltransferase
VSDDFVNLLRRLADAGVDFVVVGGFAGVAHGCTYVTQDIDICCEFSPDTLLALQKAISDLEPVHRMTPGRKKLALTEQQCSHLKNLYLDTTMGQLDCLSFIDGLGDFEQVKRASEVVEVEGLRLCVLSLDALIKAKKSMNRPRDREALLQLEAIKKLRRPKQGR